MTASFERRFGPVQLTNAVGAIAAHTIRVGDVAVRKGSILKQEDIERLSAVGIDTLCVARFGPDDVGEDEAAHRLAAVLAGDNISLQLAIGGRVNLLAARAGVLIVDKAAIQTVNSANESITAATLTTLRAVAPGRRIATVKVIPYAVDRATLEKTLSVARTSLRVQPYRRSRIAVISTLLPGLKNKTIEKTLRVLAERLRLCEARIDHEDRVPHEAEALSKSLCQAASLADLIVVFGASAVVDRRDVLPSAIKMIGGRIEHFGMPVEPGNLLLSGDLDGIPIVGAPGCARSSAENGLDWILPRFLADIPVTRADIAGLGVGGLLG